MIFSGLLYNVTETYDVAFYLSAAMFLMGGAVMTLPVLELHDFSKATTTAKSAYYARSTSTITTQTTLDHSDLED